MACLPLSNLDWKLYGWRPFAWRLGKHGQDSFPIAPDLGPIPARFPMSVQQALLEAGLIPDWNVGMNSLACEWVEHRHWDFSASVTLQPQASESKVVLEAPGLDYSGWILVDDVEAGRFEGTLISHRIDLTSFLGDGKPHLISVIFEEPPREQGQMGYTSLSRFFKPRYNYSWDWCPRIVPVGPWEPAYLLTGAEALRPRLAVTALLADDFRTGRVVVTAESAEWGVISRLRLEMRDETEKTATCDLAVNASGTVNLALENLTVEPWQPNGRGDRRLYALSLSGIDAAGKCLWIETRRIGFKHVEWRACEGAPENAEPWLCVVNGEPVFLQGANWVPPKAVYHDTARPDYERLITLYRDMGVNILRVWGGGILEKEDFYELCDEAGILVWQELPLSSSGVENCPPYDGEAINRLKQIAVEYVEKRGHHASLLLWSGGNELTWGGPEARIGEVPVDENHPCIAALADTLRRHDPHHRFIATSPTGPRFYAHAREYGKGLHHDIHGPWGLVNFKGATFSEKLDDWRAYWAADDSLFRSEAGMPGASSPECLSKYGKEDMLWPPEGPYWLHTAAWWTQEDLYRAGLAQAGTAEGGLADYIQETQMRQAEAYGIAARTCRDRFPKCGGFIIWMGHDCFPCPANNSIIDFLGIPKPAYHSLKEIFSEANNLQRKML